MAGKMNSRRDYLAHQILVSMVNGVAPPPMDGPDVDMRARYIAGWAFALANNMVALTDRDMYATGVHHVTCDCVRAFDSSIPCSCRKGP